jgi:hypothetical protein
VAISGQGVAAGTMRGMSTWGVVLATGLVTVLAAILPRLVDSRTDEAHRTAEKAERRREEKKAAFATFLVAASELVGASISHEPGDPLTTRAHAAMQGVASAAFAVELVSTIPDLREAAMASVGLMGSPFDGSSAFGENMETIRDLMTTELAAE